MATLLEEMLNLLVSTESSCLIYRNQDLVFTSRHIGVKPLLRFMEAPCREALPGDPLVLVDKVIGKAALLLAVLLGIRTIYTPLASQAAVASAAHHGIALHAREIVPSIRNRQNTGLCPLEQSVLATEDPEEALKRIRAVIAILMAP